MTKLQRVSFLVVSIIVSIAFAAWGSGAQQKGTSGAKTTITFWYSANNADPTDPYYSWMKANLDQFAQKNPNIVVSPTVVANGQEYLNKVTTAMASGATPDLFQTWTTDRLRPFVQAGRIYPLDSVINGDPQLKKVLSPTYLAYSSFNGKVYAIPTFLTSEVIFYNKSIFSKYGIEPPKTFAGLLNVVSKLRSAGVTPFALGNIQAWPGAIDYFTLFCRLYGVEGVYSNVVLHHQPQFNSPEFVQTASYLMRMKNAGAFEQNFNALSDNDAASSFKAGKAAMNFTGTWQLGSFHQALGNNLGFFNFPTVQGGKGSGDTWIVNTDSAYAISSGSKHKDQAAKLLEFLFLPSRQAALIQKGELVTSINVPFDKTKVPAITQQLMKIIPTSQGTIIPWDDQLGPGMGHEFNVGIQSILGGADPTQVFANLQKDATQKWSSNS